MTKRAATQHSNPVADGFELMKKMWGFAGLPNMPSAGNLATMAARIPQLPSMLAPTFDVDELDKRIADLRAVEHWLELNASILRTTIQSLEVQRATIATLKGIGGAMLAPMGTGAPPSEVALGLAAMQTDEARAKSTRTGAAAEAGTGTGTQPDSASAAIAAAAFNPAAWWNTLQEQFMKIAATAAPPPAAPAAKKASRRRVRKPRTDR